MARRFGTLDIVVALAVAGGLAAVAVLMRGEDLDGPVRVVDGDSLELGGRRIRIRGIDAPELAQLCHRGTVSYRCGETAREALREMARTGAVGCRSTGQDRYGRALATCRVGDTDLGAAMVLRGLAVAYGAYEAEERQARARGAGLWAGRFDPPAEWRRQRGLAGT